MNNKYNKFIAIGAMFYALGLIAYILTSYLTSKGSSREDIDHRLTQGVEMALAVFPENALGRVLSSELGGAEYEQYVTVLDKAAQSMNYEYIYMLIMRGDKLLYLASTLSPEERAAKEFIQPFDEYDDAADYAHLFKATGLDFMEYVDEYGEFRSAFKTITVNGEKVVIGADVSIADLKSIYTRDLVKSCLTGLFFLLISLPLFFFIYRKVKADQAVLAQAVEEQTSEINGLNAQLEAKIKEAQAEAEASAQAAANARQAQQEAVQARRDGILHAGEQVDEVLQSILHISRDLPGIIDESAQGATAQKEQAERTAEAMRRMSEVVRRAADNARSAAENSDLSRSKAESGARIVSDMGVGIQTMFDNIHSLKDNMQTLNKEVEGIDTVINVINDIADQTNLLALNAAIEAARAGDAGRGFAVVADEVRKLAEKTMQSTKEVGDAVRSIQSSTTNTMESVGKTTAQVAEVSERAGQAGEALQEIVGLANDVSVQVRNIASVVEEQASGTEDITRAMLEIDEISINIEAAMDRCDESVKALSDGTAKLDALVGKLHEEGRS